MCAGGGTMCAGCSTSTMCAGSGAIRVCACSTRFVSRRFTRCDDRCAMCGTRAMRVYHVTCDVRRAEVMASCVVRCGRRRSGQRPRRAPIGRCTMMVRCESACCSLYVTVSRSYVEYRLTVSNTASRGAAPDRAIRLPYVLSRMYNVEYRLAGATDHQASSTDHPWHGHGARARARRA